jgi:hypothetical protein
MTPRERPALRERHHGQQQQERVERRHDAQRAPPIEGRHVDHSGPLLLGDHQPRDEEPAQHEEDRQPESRHVQDREVERDHHHGGDGSQAVERRQVGVPELRRQRGGGGARVPGH